MSELTFFACGDTSHDMSRLLRGARRERRVFPAGAFLYRSGERRVLFDTGYAPEPWRAGPGGWAYRRMLPPRVRPGDTIAEQLDPASITHVVLSHLHPDHIGGVRFFPNAAFVLSEGVRRTLERPRLRDGLLRRLLPTWFGAATVLPSPVFAPGPHGLRTADLFGDGSYLLVDLPGHARGHLGALVEHEVLLAGDAAWGRDLLGAERRIRALPRLVSHDTPAQRATARVLLAAEQDGLRLLFSHDRHPTGRNLL
ncbi:MBL fold metallo-hydrolase [Microbacterium sp. lyk4-40-TSB-66]|uniref:MBL fold metallo-hydrolase n=1 Tax=Microbacterium sp. lyk4-40-TSB-66 TaxID=3040294 RepID=UPI00255067CC|nr:MBL fold metallo-hydrolase [Microbacterium sp. lyk4-40-TSB-66]